MTGTREPSDPNASDALFEQQLRVTEAEARAEILEESRGWARPAAEPALPATPADGMEQETSGGRRYHDLDSTPWTEPPSTRTGPFDPHLADQIGQEERNLTKLEQRIAALSRGMQDPSADDALSQQPRQSPSPHYLTFEEARTRLNIDEEELKRLVSNTELRGFRREGAILFKEDDVDNLLRAYTSEPTSVLTDEDASLAGPQRPYEIPHFPIHGRRTDTVIERPAADDDDTPPVGRAHSMGGEAEGDEVETDQLPPRRPRPVSETTRRSREQLENLFAEAADADDSLPQRRERQATSTRRHTQEELDALDDDAPTSAARRTAPAQEDEDRIDLSSLMSEQDDDPDELAEGSDDWAEKLVRRAPRPSSRGRTQPSSEDDEPSTPPPGYSKPSSSRPSARRRTPPQRREPGPIHARDLEDALDNDLEDALDNAPRKPYISKAMKITGVLGLAAVGLTVYLALKTPSDDSPENQPVSEEYQKKLEEQLSAAKTEIAQNQQQRNDLSGRVNAVEQRLNAQDLRTYLTEKRDSIENRYHAQSQRLRTAYLESITRGEDQRRTFTESFTALAAERERLLQLAQSYATLEQAGDPRRFGVKAALEQNIASFATERTAQDETNYNVAWLNVAAQLYASANQTRATAQDLSKIRQALDAREQAERENPYATAKTVERVEEELRQIREQLTNPRVAGTPARAEDPRYAPLERRVTTLERRAGLAPPLSETDAKRREYEQRIALTEQLFRAGQYTIQQRDFELQLLRDIYAPVLRQ